MLSVVVTPNAPRTKADGMHGDALRIRLAAPPVDGKANDALVAWLAQALGCLRAEIELSAGASGRHKRLRLPVEAWQVAAWIRGSR